MYNLPDLQGGRGPDSGMSALLPQAEVSEVNDSTIPIRKLRRLHKLNSFIEIMGDVVWYLGYL